jgi:hypothetical protein
VAGVSLVHLTAQVSDAAMNLLSILNSQTIEARNPYGLLRDHARDTREENPALYDSQRVVCLTETPLEHVWMMCEDIADVGILSRPTASRSRSPGHEP